MVADGVVEAVAEFVEDLLAAAAWSAQPGREATAVSVQLALHSLAGHVVAGHGCLPRTAVTAVENCSQMSRCSPSTARPEGVR